MSPDALGLEACRRVTSLGCGRFSENMGMTADKLTLKTGDHVLDGEVTGFGRHFGIKEHLKQKVAEFILEGRPVASLDGIEDLVGLLEGVFADRIEALLTIPWAPAGRAQPVHDGHRLGKSYAWARSGLGDRVRLNVFSGRHRIQFTGMQCNVYCGWFEGCDLNLLAEIFAGLLGLAFGSFLNVCVWRLPRHESVAAGRSRCPECRAAIRAWDNLPLLSFLLLLGRCRDCGTRISWRYPAIELATAALWVLCWLEFGLSVQGIGIAVFCFLALGLAAMDAETMLLPDAFTLPGIVLGVVYSGAICEGRWPVRLRCAGLSLTWAACAAALILAICGLYWLIRRREGMGIGDAKLLAMIAAWLGPANTLLTFFLAVVGGAIYGILYLAARRGQGAASAKLPFGSFLCAAVIYSAFQGPATVGWYLSLFR